MSNQTNLWYLLPLKADDIFAGSFLLFFGSLFIPLYICVAYVMFKNDKVSQIYIFSKNFKFFCQESYS